MPRDTAPEPFTPIGVALAKVAPHLGTSIPTLLSAASTSFHHLACNAACADCLADRSSPHALRSYRDCALGALDRHIEQVRALRRLLEALPTDPEAA